MSALWRLLGLQARSWRWQAAGVSLGVLVILTNVALLALSGWFIAAMGLAGLGLLRVEYFLPAAAIRALAIIRTVGRYFERLTTHEATLRLLSELRVRFYERLEPLAPARLQFHRSGDLLSRIRSDVDSLDHFYLRVIASSMAALLSVLALVVFLLKFSVSVALTDLSGLVLVGVVLPLCTYRLGLGSGREAVARRSLLRAELADTIRGAEELAVFGALKRQIGRHHEAYDALAVIQGNEARLEGAAAGLSVLVMRLTMLGAVAIAIPLVARAEMPWADLAMIARLVLGSFDAVIGLPTAYRALGEALEAARRIYHIIDAEPAVPDPTTKAPYPSTFGVTFRNVSLRYGDGEQEVLRGVSFDVPAGTALGITGPTGSGKTSLTNVLLRFWEFQSGEVLVGGVPIRGLSGETVRSFCSVVARQTHLFNTSIRENLRVARPDATDAEMPAALDDAAILGEILAMPEGLDTIVGEIGTKLSGGQARRVAIARAFLKDAPILILDEPTEGLDPSSEPIVNRSLAGLMRDRTTLLISHRPAALRNAQCILDMARQDAR